MTSVSRFSSVSTISPSVKSPSSTDGNKTLGDEGDESVTSLD